MSTVYVVPSCLVGRGIPADNIKRGLKELNPDFAFDIGGRKNLWHPDIEFAQGVFFGPPGNERHICGMDRDVCPEFSAWTHVEEWAQVPFHEVRPGETCFISPSGLPTVKRAVQDKCIQYGWRYTLGCIISANIYGCNKQALESKFGISLDKEYSDFEIAVVESRAERFVDKSISFQ